MITFPDYPSFDGIGLANLVKTRVVSPVELVNAAIERIEAYNPQLNAVIYKIYDQALAAAASKQLPQGVFQGVPFLLKDLIAGCAGVPLQFGSRLAKGWVSPHDSELVSRFRKAGLLILGKTNTPEFGLNPITEPLLFGPTRNPWNPEHTPGGSSGGSAAAVAARMVPMAHGGDGAGSLRIPAAYCGLFGLKVSRGRVPVGPDVLQIWDGMVVEHAITRSVRDSAALLDAIAGPELGSPISLPPTQKSFLASLAEEPSRLRIAVTDQPFFPAEVHPEYKQAVKQAGLLCEQLNHQVTMADLRLDYEDVKLAFMIVVAANTAANIKMLAEVLDRKNAVHYLETATAVVCAVGKNFTARDLVWARYILDKASQQVAEFFTHYDVLITPTMAVPPPVVGGLHPERLEQNVLELLRRLPYGPLLRSLTQQMASKQLAFIPFTPLFNITGQPAMSVPLYWDSQGLPIGIQFAGRIGDEGMLLQLAAQLEIAAPWADKIPAQVD